MKITERIFGGACIIEMQGREDLRGGMSVSFDTDCLLSAGIAFVPKEQRIYRMPRAGTFFGIHYQDESCPQAKLVSLIQGRGLDYIVDLRKNSPTYKRWEVRELCGGDMKAVYIPCGFGHAFLSLEDDTVQLFTADEHFVKGCARQLNHKDPQIGLELPDTEIILSDADRNAPYLT